MLPLAIICVAFVAFSLPPYLTFDPRQSRLPGLREGFPLYYPLLVTHIIFGSVALLTSCMQVWPWFRYRMARQWRFAEHREWTIRTTSIVVNRLWLVLLIIAEWWLQRGRASRHRPTRGDLFPSFFRLQQPSR